MATAIKPTYFQEKYNLLVVMSIQLILFANVTSTLTKCSCLQISDSFNNTRICHLLRSLMETKMAAHKTPNLFNGSGIF